MQFDAVLMCFGVIEWLTDMANAATNDSDTICDQLEPDVVVNEILCFIQQRCGVLAADDLSKIFADYIHSSGHREGLIDELSCQATWITSVCRSQKLRQRC